MRYLFHSLYFWLIAGVTLVLVIVAATIFFPPVSSQVRANIAQIKQLEGQIAANEQFLVSIQSLEEQRATVEKLHQQAGLSLPETAQPEILLLQLDGLLKSLELANISINVPLASTADKKDQAQAITTFTLTGAASFDQAKTLIAKLRTLSRWNKLIQASFTKSGDGTSLIISGQAFSKPLASKTYSGNANLVAEATKFFDSFQAYTTVPDVTREGNFGKTDPFGN